MTPSLRRSLLLVLAMIPAQGCGNLERASARAELVRILHEERGFDGFRFLRDTLGLDEAPPVAWQGAP